jgi:hypothetical protein
VVAQISQTGQSLYNASNKTLSLIAVTIRDPDCAPFAIQG